MPHIIVEHSDNLRELSWPVILTELHDTLAGQDTIKKGAIKTRHIPLPHCVVGKEEDANQMVHITLKLLAGRDVVLKKTMAQALYSVACGEIHQHYPEASITVEVAEMDPGTYTK